MQNYVALFMSLTKLKSQKLVLALKNSNRHQLATREVGEGICL